MENISTAMERQRASTVPRQARPTFRPAPPRSTDCVCDSGFGAAVCEEGFVISANGWVCERVTIFTNKDPVNVAVQTHTVTFASQTTCDVLIVAGVGGVGESGMSGAGGGGGAGGLLYLRKQVITADTYDIHVGRGGLMLTFCINSTRA